MSPSSVVSAFGRGEVLEFLMLIFDAVSAFEAAYKSGMWLLIVRLAGFEELRQSVNRIQVFVTTSYQFIQGPCLHHISF